MLGQERALAALKLGADLQRPGYNLFAVGRPGIGKQTLLRAQLEKQAKAQSAPNDYAYVHDFDASERPRILALPTGLGPALKRDMEDAITTLASALRAAFESEGFRSRQKALVDALAERQEKALGEVRERAAKLNVAVLQSDSGFAIAPLRDGKPLEPGAFHALPEAEQVSVRKDLDHVGDELTKLHLTFHDWGREHEASLSVLFRETARNAAEGVIAPLRTRYAALSNVVRYLTQVTDNVVDTADSFLEEKSDGFAVMLRRALNRGRPDNTSMRRFQLNLIVHNAADSGAPVVYEDNPTYANLLGRVEHESQFGALTTNFTLIKPGALHRALGGYLLLDARKVLAQPFAWDALKRTLRAGEIRLEPLSEALGLTTTVSLRPEPVPLGTTKVVLLGDRMLYHLLASLDTDFLELFKVLADFEDSLPATPEAYPSYAMLIAALVQRRGLRPFQREAVAAVLEQAARIAGDSQKLSLHLRAIADVLDEASHAAADAGSPEVAAGHVEKALAAMRARCDRPRSQLREAVRRGDVRLDVTGSQVGQVNGLSVFQLGEDYFGHPMRITASVRLGRGEVIDIEREVQLSGPLHTKGVLILGGYLGTQYGTHTPFALAATLVFEQSYGTVEGDSASLAELCALISAIADVPIAQRFALTGSVDQRGHVQSIGAVNEKIEGFFELSQERDPGGVHGVIIPASNAKNLMLRSDVVAAVEAGRFEVHAVEHVDDALALLTGLVPGRRGVEGQFPGGSVHQLVESRLRTFAERVRAFSLPHRV
jgi:lon-related putative ATP-dependent protease